MTSISKDEYIYKLNDIIAKDKPNRVYNWKVTKGKGDKLYISWKGYDDSFNS